MRILRQGKWGRMCFGFHMKSDSLVSNQMMFLPHGLASI